MSDPTFRPFRNFIPEEPERANAPERLRLSSEFLYPIVLSQEQDLEWFRQLGLRSESEFISWVRKLGISAWSGYQTSDPERLWSRGWIRADEGAIVHRSHRKWQEMAIPVSDIGQALGIPHRPAGRWHRYDLAFHPFRIYPLLKILGLMDWRLTRTSVLYGKGFIDYAGKHVRSFRTLVREPVFNTNLNWWNGIADLAILLEPLFWSKVTSQSTRILRLGSVDRSEEEEASRFPEYRQFALELVAQVPKASIALAHMELRHSAAQLDDNHELYLLLRASNWNKREKVVGKLGAALWVRHIAEVLRHAYDEIYEDRLVHEDEAFGHWYDGARTWAYGSAYPLEDIPEMRRRILPHWGMVSSPRVRFYVEGDTEEGALAYALAGLLGFGLELVNLKAQGWGTWLRQELKNDQAAKRISLFMLDNDREDDTRALKAHVRAKLVVGVIFKNSPDLETGCFQIDELLKATVYFEESIGVQDLEPLDPDDFRDINSGRKFEEQYCKIRRAPSLKGKLWGEALMRVAFESGKGEENRLVHAYACAVRGVSADYEVQRVRHPLNPETFENDSVNAEGFP